MKEREVPAPSAQEPNEKKKVPRRYPAARSGDAIRASAKDGESYAEILKAMKAKVNPQHLGAEVLSIRRTGFYLAQALSGHDCFNATSRVATADSLWTMQSAHSFSVLGGALKGRLSVRQWALNSPLTRWSLSCSSLNKNGYLPSHSSPQC